MKKLMFVGVWMLLLCQQVGAHKFRIYCYSGLAVGPNALQCYKVWDFNENTIIWNNRPQPGVLIATINNVDVNYWYEFQSPELDQYIDSCVLNSHPICFRVKREIQGPSNVVWKYHSKEQDLNLCPQLIVNNNTITPPADDARVYEEFPYTNYCCDYLWACNYDSPQRQEFFVKFKPPVGVEEDFSKDKTRFLRCSPTVFTAFASISYNLVPEDAGKPIVLSVYDVAGNLVKKLVNTSGTPGCHEVVWDSKDGNGNSVPAGCYFYRLKVGELTLTTKGLLLR